jgi:hypothetical protein
MLGSQVTRHPVIEGQAAGIQLSAITTCWAVGRKGQTTTRAHQSGVVVRSRLLSIVLRVVVLILSQPPPCLLLLAGVS